MTIKEHTRPDGYMPSRGDWVRFYESGRAVIASVLAVVSIVEMDGKRHWYAMTDRGKIDIRQIIDWRA